MDPNTRIEITKIISIGQEIGVDTKDSFPFLILMCQTCP